MKNLSDIAKSMSGDAGVQDLSLATSQLKLHSGVNFLGMDIDDAETLVRAQLLNYMISGRLWYVELIHLNQYGDIYSPI